MPGNQNSGGRNKLSASAHVLRGTFRADRHADDTTPEPPIGAPQPPKPLAGDAKAEWNRMVESLVQTKTLSTVDRHALFQYCELFAETQTLKEKYWQIEKQTRQLTKIIAKQKLDGTEFVAALKQVTELQRQSIGLVTKLRQNRLGLRTWLVEFGLTPSARTRVKQLGGGVERPKSKVDQFRGMKAGGA